MQEKKEESNNQMTLFDFLNKNMQSESVSSTIHRSTIRQRSSLPIKCTVRKSKKKNCKDSHLWSANEMPIRGSRFQSNHMKRLYEQLLYAQEKEIQEKTIKKMLLSELTGRSIAALRPSHKESNDLLIPPFKKTSSASTSVVKISKVKGYPSKKSRVMKAQQAMREFLGNYERIRFKKLDENIKKSIREEVLKSNRHNYLLLN